MMIETMRGISGNSESVCCRASEAGRHPRVRTMLFTEIQYRS